MHISHTITSIDTSTGGPARSVTHLVSELAHADKSLFISLHTSRSQDPILMSFSSPNANLHFHEYNRFGGLRKLKKGFSSQQPHLFHGHGLWQMPVKQMANYALSQNIPYIITPRGMLEPWSLTQGAYKKKVALKLYQAKVLRNANCIHATAEMEAENIRSLGFKNPIAVIPNGIPLEDFQVNSITKKNEPKILLFLSRIHRKKGVELLVDAWEALPLALTKDWQVHIAGNGESDYIDQLKNVIKERGLTHQLKLVGPLNGSEKLKAYQSAKAFVLPTYSENFGIVVAEALACGIPVITTHGTPWEDLETYDCGWWIPLNVADLTMTLETVLSLPELTLATMGGKGRQLIEEKYSMRAVTDKMLSLYHWVLHKGDQPEFVYLK